MELKGRAKKSKESINPYRLYGDLIYNHMTKGMAERDVEFGSDEVCINYNTVTGSKYRTYYYQVAGIEEYIKDQFITSLRIHLRNLIGRRTFADLIALNEPYSVNWNSRHLSSNVDLWRMRRKKLKKAKDKSQEDGYESGVSQQVQSRQGRNEFSWKHFQACEAEDIPACVSGMLVRIKLPKESKVETAQLHEILNHKLALEGIKLKPVSLVVDDFVSSSSPFTSVRTEQAKKMLSTRALTSDIVCKFLGTDQGHFSDGSVVLGFDRSSGRPVTLDVLGNLRSGCNIFIIGGTGAGKSVLLKNINEEVLANNFYLYFNDYEAFEYIPQGKLYGAKFLDFGGRDGKYFEPLRLTNVTGIQEIDDELYSNALSTYYAYISIMKGDSLTATQKTLLSQVVTTIYKDSGVVVDDRSTWHLSEKCSMLDTYAILNSFRFSNEMVRRYGDDLLKLVDVVELYFSPEGVYNYMFRNPISIGELKDERIIITRFGKNSAGIMTKDVNVERRIKQLSKITLDRELGRIRMFRGEPYLTAYEEVQSYMEDEGSEENLRILYSTVRKTNGIVLSVMNDVEKMSSRLTSLIENSKYVILGKVDNLKPLEEIITTGKLQGCYRSARRVSKLRNCFLVKDGNQVSIFKCELPHYMMEGPVYKTITTNENWRG